MQIHFNDLLYALSLALDYVESEQTGIKPFHAERVAYIAVLLGRTYGVSDSVLLSLAAAAALHDNALTECCSLRWQTQPEPFLADAKRKDFSLALRSHCFMGEKNLQLFAFYPMVRNAILYHHENADGSGPFHLQPTATPLFAQYIHLAHLLDCHFSLNQMSLETQPLIDVWLRRHTDHLFTAELAAAFASLCPAALADDLRDSNIRQRLQNLLPHVAQEYPRSELQNMATLFAHIIDYKSHFTCTHSADIAQKAEQLGRYLQQDTETCTKLYLAGALHDIGKLTVASAILEKPDRLTPREYTIVKKHALASWQILKPLTDLLDVVEWAASHHEKLNGSGYPFGKNAAQLSFGARLLGCIDIYQALIEARPYKKVMPHRQAISMMRIMVRNGEIDGPLTEAINQCFLQ